MDLGPQLADALLRAHRTRRHGAVCAEAMTLHLNAERVLSVEGVPDLLADLGDRGQRGVLSLDLPMLRAAGLPQRRIADAACGGVQRALVRLIRGPGQCEWVEGGPPPPTALELPVTMLRLFSQALAEARDPQQVERDFSRVGGAVLRVDTERTRLFQLDLIAHRTLSQALSSRSVAELIRTAGRGDLNRTRHAWRAFDLLYHLGLVSLDLMEPLVAMERDTEPLRVLIETTEPMNCGDEDEVATEDLPQVTLDEPIEATDPSIGRLPVIDPFLNPQAKDDLPTGDWVGAGERVEVPLTLQDLRRMAFEFTWSNPLEVVGVAPWEPAEAELVEKAYTRRLEEFRPANFFPDPEAMEAGATCRRLLRAARAMLDDAESLARWEADRQV